PCSFHRACLCCFFFSPPLDHRFLHSFPTRRSSDLGVCGVAVFCLRCGRDSWCRWSVGPSATAGCSLGGGGVGGPRPGRREPVHGGFSATSVSPKPGRRPPPPPPRIFAGAAAEGPALHLPGPSPALAVVGWAGSCAGDEASFASACGVRADASQVTSASPVAEAALLAAACSRVQVDQRKWVMPGSEATRPPGPFATAQQSRPGGLSDSRCDDAS